MHRLALAPLVLVLLAAVAACRSGPPPREFEIVGQIQAVASERGEVTLKHEDIKGFMPGMTMAFKAGPEVLGGKRPGDLVTGTLVVGEVEVYVSKLSVTGHRALAAATPLPADGSAIIQPCSSISNTKDQSLSTWFPIAWTRCSCVPMARLRILSQS